MWGRVSDKIGRKPVLLIGLCGVFISMNCFGLAKTMPQMMLARVVAGFANGNLGVMKALLGEITDETNQARAFSYLPICYSLGSLIGPAIGGSLSDPVQHIPIFRHSEFLKEYPYWLRASSFRAHFILLTCLKLASVPHSSTSSASSLVTSSSKKHSLANRRETATIHAIVVPAFAKSLHHLLSRHSQMPA